MNFGRRLARLSGLGKKLDTRQKKTSKAETYVCYPRRTLGVKANGKLEINFAYFAPKIFLHLVDSFCNTCLESKLIK